MARKKKEEEILEDEEVEIQEENLGQEDEDLPDTPSNSFEVGGQIHAQSDIFNILFDEQLIIPD